MKKKSIIAFLIINFFSNAAYTSDICSLFNANNANLNQVTERQELLLEQTIASIMYTVKERGSQQSYAFIGSPEIQTQFLIMLKKQLDNLVADGLPVATFLFQPSYTSVLDFAYLFEIATHQLLGKSDLPEFLPRDGHDDYLWKTAFTSFQKALYERFPHPGRHAIIMIEQWDQLLKSMFGTDYFEKNYQAREGLVEGLWEGRVRMELNIGNITFVITTNRKDFQSIRRRPIFQLFMPMFLDN